MYIHHIAIWVKDIELMKDFYTKYFNCTAGERYENKAKDFVSYFLSFDNGTKIELMHKSDVTIFTNAEKLGLAHIAIKLKDKCKVDELTERLKRDGYKIISEPRLTGDGYYESCILDPEENRIEIVY